MFERFSRGLFKMSKKRGPDLLETAEKAMPFVVHVTDVPFEELHRNRDGSLDLKAAESTSASSHSLR